MIGLIKTMRWAAGCAVACALLCGCEQGRVFDDPYTDLMEFESVYQFLEAMTIWQDHLPQDRFDFASPAALLEAVGDTLRGANYTRYYEEYNALAMVADNGNSSVYLDSLTPSTGLLTITGFKGQTWEDFKPHIPRAAKFSNIVVDLRDNRGGYLDVLDSIMEAMLPESTAYIQARYRDYDDPLKAFVTYDWHEWLTARGPRPEFEGKKYAVLMDGLSASASEILIAALYEAGHVPLIGEQTYGKGIGQVHISRRTRKTVQITFLMLRGVSERIGDYHRKGIVPDSLPEQVRQAGAVLSPDRQPVFYAVRALEPQVGVADINYPERQGNAPAGISAMPACAKVISEQEILSRLGR